MDDRVLLKVYYFGQIFLQTFEGVKFICEDPLDVIIPFTISFEEFKCVIYEKIDSEMSRKISYVANALANEVPFEEPSFMRVLDLEAMHASEFPEYMSASDERVYPPKKCRLLVYESEPLTFYAKCTQYGSGCDWLIRVSMINRKYCWVIRRIFEEAGNIQVNCFDRQNEVFEVREMPSRLEHVVDSVVNNVTVVRSRWTGFLVDMCLHVVQIND
ncbi:hypothetical protein Ahy_B09g098813 [Arachis hypogaea]|uniref:Transposase MuDR plant domain-containing protein n=1 Tax=Arachis hypogaea TaxID=3818 RepID=A0A444XS62_ARAHY|nr:hypothetical protein Ahy_B09g098813 [Arachis hypogaea]